jgi:tetratricopeptide (TPR) repeat protein
MQALAPIGSIAATHHTQKLCEGYFTFKSLGPATIKGVKDPVNAFEVTGLGPLRTRLQVAAQRGLTRFVGRSGELEQMRRALELAKSGHGQIVAAIGEPGVGKSRLFFEFRAIVQSGCLVLEAYSVSHGKASAYLPVIELLKSYFEIDAEDDERKRREKVTGKVLALDRSLEDTLSWLFGLLDIGQEGEGLTPSPEALFSKYQAHLLAELDPQTRGHRTLEAIKRILLRESISQPLIIVFEDLHWIDGETQALLNLVVDSLATSHILLLVNYRPEYHHQWGNKSYYMQIRLDPLGRESADEMLAALLGSELPLPDQREGRGEGLAPLKRLIIERTEGNPFFMEEMVQAFFEQGALVRDGTVKLAKPLDQIRVPLTVQAILASRIDRLSASEKELLQTLAVLGREFPLGLIKRMAARLDDELERMLSALQLAEFIYEQPAVGDIEYQFKHALTQEVAYSSVLTERRRMLHERAGQAIEALYASRLEDHLTELAHHFDRSGNVPKAVEYLDRTGVRAAQQGAHSEAIGYFTRALELLRRLPEGAARDRQELDLQLALGLSLPVIRGPATPQIEAVLVRAQKLSEELGDYARLMEALLALAFFRMARREVSAARELARRALAMAESAKAMPILEAAHFRLGVISLLSGQLEAAREHLERAGSSRVGPFRTSAASFLPLVLCLLGYPAQALTKSHESLVDARRLSDPLVIANALFHEAGLHSLLRDSRTAMERAEELLLIATEHGIVHYLTAATIVRGWSLVAGGRGAEGIAEMRRAISTARGDFVITGWFAMLAAAYARNGRQEEGLAVVSDGLVQAGQTGESEEAELHRVKGELTMMNGDETKAEHCFRTAIDIARRQKARFFELRATTSLARLLKRQLKREEARAMLSVIYDWFTEGFEFPDFKDAKALLDELGS